MASFNAAAFLADAMRSVLRQSGVALELIVVDDASSDASPAIARGLAADDNRVRVLVLPRNAGPAAARNAGLAAARGRWIAVADADDLLHPFRLSRLLDAAERDGADLVADDLLLFDDARATPPRTLLGWPGPRRVGLAEYVASNALHRRDCLGLLKPLFRAALLARTGLRYDPALRNAEDADLVMRLMAAGGTLLVVPEPLYLYRKHGGSISHRLSPAKLAAMDGAARDFAATPGLAPAVTAAVAGLRRSFVVAEAWEALVAAVKRGSPAAALAILLRRPALGLRLLAAALPRRRRKPTIPPAGPQLVLLTRQRIVGATNGSSAYLLALLDAVAASGMAIHLLCPSPAMFGRWPWLRLAPEMAVFASLTVRRGIRLGSILVCTDPAVWWRAGLGIAGRLLSRLGIALPALDRRAPYSIGVPWVAADRVFTARHAPARLDAVLCDYAFLAEGIPFLLHPAARTAIVQHDLFHTRAAAFAATGSADSVAALDAASEWAMLGQADAVIAIQAREAAATQAALPASRVITAPMAVKPVAAPAPGEDGTVLFAGSNTAPNVQGVRWLLDQVWPAVRAADPGATLEIAGSVCAAVGAVPAGVRKLGLVPDLAPHYRRAAVVASPLHAGSGLKIKLIEAWGAGKAVVATSVTLQGVEALGGTAALVADDPAGFAAALLALLRDPAARTALGAAALVAVRERFSAAACFAETVAFLSGTVSPPLAAPVRPLIEATP